MKILKHGEKKTVKFVCKNCGCEFIAQTKEFDVQKFNSSTAYSCHCPECGWYCETDEAEAAHA